MQQFLRQCDRIATLPASRAALVRRVRLWLAALGLAVTGLAVAAAPSGTVNNAGPTTAATATASSAPKAKVAPKSKAGGAKLRVSPYAKFRRERESADRAKGSAPHPGTDRPAGQSPAHRRPK